MKLKEVLKRVCAVVVIIALTGYYCVFGVSPEAATKVAHGAEKGGTKN